MTKDKEWVQANNKIITFPNKLSIARVIRSPKFFVLLI